jgi:hypothetical protein
MNPTSVIVMPLPTADWRVELSPGEQPFQFPTKGQAISFALAWAEHHQANDVRVFGRVGALERLITLPDGDYRRAPGSERRRMQVDPWIPDRRREDRRRQVGRGEPEERRVAT